MPVFKSWNGSSWITHGGWQAPKVWNGSAWIQFNPKLWTGSGWGVVSVPQSRIVTVGTIYDPGDGKFIPASNYYGYDSVSYGSINNNSLQLWEDGQISAIYWAETAQNVRLAVTGSNLSNANFTTMTIGSTAFSRASGAYTLGSGAHTWSWSSATNPFGATGGNTTVSWT